MIGSYYSLDIPAATKNQLESYMGGGDFETRFQLLYTIYAAPNVRNVCCVNCLLSPLGRLFCLYLVDS